MNCWVADGRTSSYLDIFGYIIMYKIIKRNEKGNKQCSGILFYYLASKIFHLVLSAYFSTHCRRRLYKGGFVFLQSQDFPSSGSARLEVEAASGILLQAALTQVSYPRPLGATLGVRCQLEVSAVQPPLMEWCRTLAGPPQERRFPFSWWDPKCQSGLHVHTSRKYWILSNCIRPKDVSVIKTKKCNCIKPQDFFFFSGQEKEMEYVLCLSDRVSWFFLFWGIKRWQEVLNSSYFMHIYAYLCNYGCFTMFQRKPMTNRSLELLQ